MFRVALAVILAVIHLGEASAQSFTCPIGKQPSCLEYNDNICDGYAAKCVKRDAVCFDSYTCDFKGFICKSKFDDAVEEYEDLQKEYNDLVNTANLCNANLSSVSTSLSSEEAKASRLQADLDRFKNCVESAETVEDAKSCN